MRATSLTRVLIAPCVAAVLAAAPVSALACPVCDSPVAEQVRAAIADDDFGSNLLAVVLPFLVFRGAVAVIRFCVPGRRR